MFQVSSLGKKRYTCEEHIGIVEVDERELDCISILEIELKDPFLFQVETDSIQKVLPTIN